SGARIPERIEPRLARAEPPATRSDRAQGSRQRDPRESRGLRLRAQRAAGSGHTCALALSAGSGRTCALSPAPLASARAPAVPVPPTLSAGSGRTCALSPAPL
ncbi:unnamed protein product, partial [Coccothraustes coccothraustes]